MDTEHVVITIDGGAGTGTTSLARELAAHLRWPYLNTGHLYRGVANEVQVTGTNPHNEVQVTKIAEEIHFDFDGGSVVKVNDKPITAEQLAAMSDLVPHIAHYPGVREHIRRWQKTFASDRHCIIEGRDLGSVVFPNSPFKIFLICDDEVRAIRRSNQLGRDVTVAELRERDRLDSEREASPMVRPAGAHQLDTTHISVPRLVTAVEVFMHGVPEIRAALGK
ncbi:(d)CMP kinase [bacterium]|nr:(d)CMP kinase [bacterium]